VAHELKETLRKFSEFDARVPAFPKDEFHQIWKLRSPLQYKNWPWWVQVPVQVSLVVIVVMGVLSVPYVGEWVPLLSPKTAQVDNLPVDSKEPISAVTEKAEGLPQPAPVEAVEVAATPSHTTPPQVTRYFPFETPFYDPTVQPRIIAGPPAQTSPQPLAVEPAKPEASPVASAPPSTPVPPRVAQVAVAPSEPKTVTTADRIFFRWGAFAGELDVVTPQIIEMLNRYGAERAGELELGSQYRGGRYFHFSVGEASFESLMSELRGLAITEFTNTQAISTDRRTAPGQRRVVFLIRPNP
jgi:hypothetical protein